MVVRSDRWWCWNVFCWVRVAYHFFSPDFFVFWWGYLGCISTNVRSILGVAPLTVTVTFPGVSWNFRIGELYKQTFMDATIACILGPRGHPQGESTTIYMGVSKNNGTPKSSHFNRVWNHYFHHPFWGFSPYFWKHPHVSHHVVSTKFDRLILDQPTPGPYRCNRLVALSREGFFRNPGNGMMCKEYR